MSRQTLARTGRYGFLGALAVGVAVLQMLLPAPARAQQVTMETLLDRIQIEDLLVRYYYDLTMGRAHEMSEYFTEDALLDVDGTIANAARKSKDCMAVDAPATRTPHRAHATACC